MKCYGRVSGCFDGGEEALERVGRLIWGLWKETRLANWVEC